MRKKPHLRRYRVRCRHCRIFFLTDPRNEGRTDLGCPFGCADLHRRKESNRRSAEYNRSASGKLKRKQRQEARALVGSSRGSDESAPLQAPPAATEPARSTDRVEGKRGSQARRDRFLPEATPSPIAGSEPAGLEPVEIAVGMLGYLRSVVSLIEGRCVHLGEVLQMLQRMERQHSFARERRIDYVLRYLSEHPP